MDLQWVPHKPDQLITWAQDIVLYKIEDVCHSQDASDSAVKGPSIQISPMQTATQLVKLKQFPYPKVVDCYPGTDADGMMAIGLGNGKVVLTSFGETIINKEFAPKHTRQINSLCWNKHSPNLLATGLDKARSDHAVVIWDIQSTQKLNGFHSDALRSELGHSETAQSVAWVTAKTLLVGMNGKHIKLFDLRDIQAKLERTASTKAVYGISVDGNQRVASFADNQAFVWDFRNLDKPFAVLNHNKNISKIGWCPTRSGLLACLEKDSFHVQLHDVHHAAMSSEEGEPAVLDRSLTPSYISSGMSNSTHGHGPAAQIASFAWHPSDENVLTTKSASGTLWNSVVYERVTLNWSPTSKLCWSNGKKIIQYIDNTDDVYAQLDDISVKMKQRALLGYGLKKGLRENCALVQDDESLRYLWEWLEYCHHVTDRDKYRVPFIGNQRFPGVRTILKMDSTKAEPIKSELIINSSFDLSNNKKTYQSEERKFVQALCGWDSDSGTGETPSCASRKAAIALFHLKLRHCIRILSDSGHQYWPIVATAIAGFNDDRNSLWREMAQLNFTKLNDPYIRAIFAFLTETDSNYDVILNESGVDLADRVGFACSFLNDAKLINFIQEVTNDMTRKGDLHGVLLTGMTPSVLPLLQRYLDMTGDVQTVSLLAIRTMPLEISSINQLKFWIERYRDLLNSWKLWESRAEFDIFKNSNNPALIPQPKVTVSCSFCGKNISTVGLGSLNRSTQIFSRFTTTNAKLKLSCCPSCRKPLPRCAICLLHMGTVLGSSTEPIRELQKTGASPEALSWYTWCQTCFHGGHTIHLQQWFCTQSECPVSGCSCKCSSLDKIVDFPH